MKSILFIMPNLSGGGAEKVLIEILKNFDYQSYSVDLFLEYKIGIYINEIPSEVNVISPHKRLNLITKCLRKIQTLPIIKNLFYKFYLVPLLKRKTKNHYDAIISFMEGEALKDHIAIKHKTLNNITWVHTDLKDNHWTVKHIFSTQEEKQCYSEMNHIVFVSKEALKKFDSLYNIECNKTIIYNPIDKENIIKCAQENPIKRPKSFIICAVGRLTHAKRFDRLIHVANLLKQENYNFEIWIMGKGELEKQLKILCNKYNLNNEIKFLGFRTPPYPYINAADILIRTSDAEAFSLVIAEALCLGKPIISTKTAGPLELLENGKYGILTNSTNEDICNGIKSLIKSPNLYEHYQNLALKRSDYFDTPKQVVQKIYNLITEL